MLIATKEDRLKSGGDLRITKEENAIARKMTC